MNPPLREEADRQAIIEGLQDNTIDMIATDHAPHTAREKEKPLTEAPSGIIGLETSLSLGIMNLVDTGKLTLLQLLERMSLAPARLYHLDAGYLAEGGPADLILFDEKELWKAEHFHSKSSNTPVEMQLNENKRSNAEEFAKLFHISSGVMSGNAGEADIASLARLAAIPLMTVIQCALNRDLLLENEKGKLYFAFDTKELLKGDMQSRFAAYKTALESNFMQIDEVRYAEDMEPLGLSWVKLGLDDVLYDPKTKRIYTPNTNQTSVMGEQTLPRKTPMQERACADPMDRAAEALANYMELRYNENHDPESGRFTSGTGGVGVQ